jgi:hypothetical protein
MADRLLAARALRLITAREKQRQVVNRERRALAVIDAAVAACVAVQLRKRGPK